MTRKHENAERDIVSLEEHSVFWQVCKFRQIRYICKLMLHTRFLYSRNHRKKKHRAFSNSKRNNE